VSVDNNKKSQYDIEQKIKQGLANGLNSGDFSGLNEAISDSVKGVLKEASDAVGESLKEASAQVASEMKKAGNQVNNAASYGYQKPHSNPRASQEYAQKLKEQREAHNREVKAREEALKLQKEELRNKGTSIVVSKNGNNLPVKFEPKGQYSGPLCIAGGATGLVLSTAGIVKGAVGLLMGTGGLFALCAPVVFAGAFAILMKSGFSQKATLDRAKRYAQICGSNMYAQISSIAAAMGIKQNKVKNDIRKLLRKGFFPEGYLDDEETTLMLSDDIYKQYRQTKQYSITATAAATASDLAITGSEKAKNAKAKLSAEELAELNDMVNEGRDHIARLRKYNNDIPGENITKKLNHLESLLVQIFTRVEEHPEQMKRMHKLMDYYLPTMQKLVEAYAEYDKISNPGPEIISAKEEIEKTLDTINEAFIQLLNNLFQDSVWDVTTDAQVLKTMLKQEGLASDIEE